MPATPNAVFPKWGGDFFQTHDQKATSTQQLGSLTNMGELSVNGTTHQTFPISLMSRHPHFIEGNAQDVAG